MREPWELLIAGPQDAGRGVLLLPGREPTRRGRSICVDKIEAAELVDREMIAEIQADGELSREHAKEMEQALRSSRVIGAAIGILMASRSLNEDQAFAVLAKASQDSNRKLRDIAQLLVRGTPGEELSR